MKKKTKSNKHGKKEDVTDSEVPEEESEASFVSSESDESQEELKLAEEEEGGEEDNSDGNENDSFDYSDQDEKKESSGNKHMLDREVRTPDWEALANSGDENKPEITEPFDMIRTHRRMQIIEARIINAVDKEHIHPAFSAEIEHSTPDLNETERELIELGNYRTRLERKKIPRYWVPRVYDNEKDIMSRDKSDQLKQEIAHFQEIGLNG